MSLVYVLVLWVRTFFFIEANVDHSFLLPFFNSSVCNRTMLDNKCRRKSVTHQLCWNRHAGDAVKTHAVSKLRKWLGVALGWGETPNFGRSIQTRAHMAFTIYFDILLYVDCISCFQGRICAIAPVPLPHLAIEHGPPTLSGNFRTLKWRYCTI